MYDLPTWVQILEALALAFQSIVTPILIAIGGFFAWYKFIRRGEHDPKLQLTISGTVGWGAGTVYLQARALAENQGQVSVDLNGAMCALQLSTRKRGDSDWALRATERVFEVQGFVQPGETLVDQVWLEIPDSEEVAIKMELIVLTSDASTGWVANEVVNLVAQRDNDAPESETS